MSDIVLSAGIRSNLLSLQNSSQLLDRTQLRLSTGRKVNTALDDPLSYFTSAALGQQANDMNRLLDNIGLGLKTIEAADSAIRSIQTLIESSLAGARASLQSAATNARVGSGMDPITRQAVDYLTNPNLVGGTPAGKFNNGDQITIASTNPALTIGPITFGATYTITQLVTAINTAVGNLDAQTGQPYVKASVDQAGRLIIDQTTGGTLQITLTDAGAANTLTDLFGTYEPANPAATATTTGVIPSTTNATRSAFAQTFRDNLDQISNMAKDAGYNGVNLLFGQSLDMILNIDATTRMVVRGVMFDSAGLGLADTDAKYNFQSDTEIANAIAKLNNATKLLRSQAAAFGSNATVAKTREAFTREAVKTLRSGSDGLITADMNEEGANLLALQTRQQLSTQALSLAAQSDQAVLRLFG